MTAPARGRERKVSERSTNRYEAIAPGELVHVDVAKFARIPAGGGHRMVGRRASRANTRKDPRAGGYDFLHAAVDDHSRLTYAELLDAEDTAACVAFWRRAHRFLAANGICATSGNRSEPNLDRTDDGHPPASTATSPARPSCIADTPGPHPAGILAGMDTATRLLELLGLLHARPVWSGEVLADRLGVTRRTVRRDVARLRDLDYPVESVPGPHGGYRLGRGVEMPPLVLDDQEALAVVLGLRTAAVNLTDELDEAAATALAKLERVLPDRLADRVRDLSEATLAMGGRHEIPADPDQLLLLAQACRRGQRVRFMYTDREGTRTMRHVDPYRLVHVARRWYVVSWDLERVDWRTFRVDRLSSTYATGEDADLPEEPDARAMVRQAIGHAAWPVRARVRLHLPHEELQWLPASAGVVEAETEDTTLWSTGGSDPERLAGWLASFPCRVEVLEPDDLAKALDTHLHRVAGSS